jgi:hypothetical protein
MTAAPADRDALCHLLFIETAGQLHPSQSALSTYLPSNDLGNPQLCTSILCATHAATTLPYMRAYCRCNLDDEEDPVEAMLFWRYSSTTGSSSSSKSHLHMCTPCILTNLISFYAATNASHPPFMATRESCSMCNTAILLSVVILSLKKLL